jgi:Holliday junction resolvasome RuvABC endonuclease subunit
MRRQKSSATETTIVGIDLSLNGTGICSDALQSEGSEGGKCLFTITAGFLFREITFKSVTPRHEKWAKIRGVIRQATSAPDTVVIIEGYAFGGQGNNVICGAEIGGIVRMDLFTRDVPFVEVPPSTLKKFVSGKGNIKKNLMLKEVYRVWNMNLDSDNLADAFGLMKIGQVLLKRETATKAQRESLKKVEWESVVKNMR